MITGRVNARHEIVLRLPVRDAAGQELEEDFILDTGFTGSLTMPSQLVANLGLPWDSRGAVTLGNGSTEYFDVYTATVIWNGLSRSVLVQEVETAPLVGMALLRGHTLWAEIADGGAVQIEALP